MSIWGHLGWLSHALSRRLNKSAVVPASGKFEPSPVAWPDCRYSRATVRTKHVGLLVWESATSRTFAARFIGRVGTVEWTESAWQWTYLKTNSPRYVIHDVYIALRFCVIRVKVRSLRRTDVKFWSFVSNFLQRRICFASTARASACFIASMMMCEVCCSLSGTVYVALALGVAKFALTTL